MSAGVCGFVPPVCGQLMSVWLFILLYQEFSSHLNASRWEIVSPWHIRTVECCAVVKYEQSTSYGIGMERSPNEAWKWRKKGVVGNSYSELYFLIQKEFKLQHFCSSNVWEMFCSY